MQKRKFGNAGREVPVIGQGSWQFPSASADIEEAKIALRHGVEAGMTHIDTAEMYGDAELIIAQAIKDLPRQDLFIVSKVLPSNAAYESVFKACERSLKRLKLDYLDCYLLHWRGARALAETMAALEKLVDEGKIRSLGVSNFDVEDLEEARGCLQKHKIACNQVLYNLHERGIERRLIPYCRAAGIAIVAYTPFGQRPSPSPESKGGKILASFAAAHEATVRQIILAFLVREEMTFTIPKAAKRAHTLENAGAGKIILTPSEIAQIDELFPVPEKDQPLAMI